MYHKKGKLYSSPITMVLLEIFSASNILRFMGLGATFVMVYLLPIQTVQIGIISKDPLRSDILIAVGGTLFSLMLPVLKDLVLAWLDKKKG